MQMSLYPLSLKSMYLPLNWEVLFINRFWSLLKIPFKSIRPIII